MKRILTTLTLIAFAPACATRYAYNCHEYCATKGMACTGQSDVSGSAVSTSYGAQPVHTWSSGTAYSCRVSATEEDKANVARAVASAQETHEKDQSAKRRNIWYWIGGVAAAFAISFAIPET